MIQLACGYRQAARAVTYTIPALIVLYGSPWLLSGATGFTEAPLHPMLILCAVIAAYHGVVAGLTTLALALGPYAAFDIPLRSGDEMLHLHLLQVLSWPAFSAVAVALFGSARDLREGELSVARQMIVRLRDELAIVQKAADAALDALKRNEAEIAMRRDITPLMVIKALNRLRKPQPASFARDLAHVFRLIAPAADFALLSEDGEAIAASGSIRTSTLDQMRRCIPGALENGSKVSPAVRKALDSDARKTLTLRVTGEPKLVLCVTCASSLEAEEIADYLPEVGDAIGQTARKLVPKRPRERPSREVA